MLVTGWKVHYVFLVRPPPPPLFPIPGLKAKLAGWGQWGENRGELPLSCNEKEELHTHLHKYNQYMQAPYQWTTIYILCEWPFIKHYWLGILTLTTKIEKS